MILDIKRFTNEELTNEISRRLGNGENPRKVLEPKPKGLVIDWEKFGKIIIKSKSKFPPLGRVFEEREKKRLQHLVDAYNEQVSLLKTEYGLKDSQVLKLNAYNFATTRGEVGGNLLPVRETFAESEDEFRWNLIYRRFRYLGLLDDKNNVLLKKAMGRIGIGLYELNQSLHENELVNEIKDLGGVFGGLYGRAKYLYAWPDPETGFVYGGRGFQQLTWRGNYEKEGIHLNPDKALDPVWSAKLSLRGLMDGRWNGHGKGLMYYLDGNFKEWEGAVQARRTINVLDRAGQFAEWYFDFLSALEGSAQ